ncbi:5-formyltetrahydrofolate cyclo-ligase [Clostridium magnum]|uniref:5-formyltetrahydrofolate cyclo-ligase n=1 Tax=Clostridium magnum DSM 2767 TaxID=1121326 RepID=A0A162TL25_9CLOT|nr:5-formyltetrahydrofolate cyclo-ligase [Clostridium magnum]KZL92780.1 putative 5-formyltetrahydrofolate cyclo-ligase [Clostridium magnum DSM 2767]SHJ40857.1 5-formyltetrahydrofolate cyclo-ligase [Clostridium magnum DSM 2767]
MDLLSKTTFRKLVLEKRDAVAMDTRKKWDEEVFKRIIHNEFYINSNIIFTFVSFGSEVNTHQIINLALNDNKIIYVPKIKSKEKGIEIFRINSLSDLRPGYFDILEPSENCSAADSRDIDLILMPGVAFDRQGGRLGYGAGFYDRFLTKMSKKVSKIALAYQLQVVNSVPMESSDVRIDGIITNEELITIN